MKFLICGGGTGGHISPAIAIYEALRERCPDSSFLFVGRTGGQENQAYLQTGEPFYTLNIKGINGKSPIKALSGAITATKALYKAYQIIKKTRPNVVIGTGGYVSWPILTAAKKMKIPTVIHESNAFPGLTTRIVSKGATRVLLNYEEAREKLKEQKNIRVVGNPLRKVFYTANRRLERKKLGVRDNDILILSFGGSLGSKKLNDTIISLMKTHSSQSNGIKHIHATGRGYYDSLPDKDKKQLSSEKGCLIVPYVENMAEVMNAADIVIARCGAMTISEINAVGVASILIPSPNVSDDHQRKNGIFMVESGAAIMIEESNLNERTLLDAVRTLENNKAKRLSLAKRAKRLGQKDSAQKITDEILSIMT